VRAPAAAHFCAALEPLGIAASRDDPGARVFTTGADRAAARALVGEACSLPLVALHPGSGSPRKNWPIDHWVRVLGELHRETPCRVVAIVGEVESESWERSRVADALPPDALFVRNAPTPILAALFERCALFLGHDSGPAHLAAAAGCPCVLVFGPTDPEMWAPPHPWVRSIRRGGSPTDTSVGDVVACARTILSPV
jgi:heptosyltransferase-2